MIRLAKSSDLKEIKNLTEACAIALQERGIYQWNENYPSEEKLRADIEKEELYLLMKKNLISGIIVLTPEMGEEYLPVEWLIPNENNLYVHRLAIHPSVWGEGYGQELMDFAEKYAGEQEYVSVRLDTFSQNSRNQEFYAKRGYQRLGTIYFHFKSEHPFYCYEKLIG